MENNSLIGPRNNLDKHVSNASFMTSKLPSLDHRNLSILHLDDHISYSNGVSDAILKKFPNATITKIQNGSEALEYVKDHFINNKPPDLIITDILHPGLNGIDFCKGVRQEEKKYNKTFPILVISMLDDTSIKSQIESLPLTKYLSKCAWGEEINLAINNLTE